MQRIGGSSITTGASVRLTTGASVFVGTARPTRQVEALVRVDEARVQ
jgi:hypothetical protein